MRNQFEQILIKMSDGDLPVKSGALFDIQVLLTEVYLVDVFDCIQYGINNRN